MIERHTHSLQKGHCTRNIEEATNIMNSEVSDIEILEGTLLRSEKITQILDIIGVDDTKQELQKDTLLLFERRVS